MGAARWWLAASLGEAYPGGAWFVRPPYGTRGALLLGDKNNSISHVCFAFGNGLLCARFAAGVHVLFVALFWF